MDLRLTCLPRFERRNARFQPVDALVDDGHDVEQRRHVRFEGRQAMLDVSEARLDEIHPMEGGLEVLTRLGSKRACLIADLDQDLGRDLVSHGAF